MNGINTVHGTATVIPAGSNRLTALIDLDDPKRIVLVAVKDGLDGTVDDGIASTGAISQDFEALLEGYTFNAMFHLDHMKHGKKFDNVKTLRAMPSKRKLRIIEGTNICRRGVTH